MSVECLESTAVVEEHVPYFWVTSFSVSATMRLAIELSLTCVVCSLTPHRKPAGMTQRCISLVFTFHTTQTTSPYVRRLSLFSLNRPLHLSYLSQPLLSLVSTSTPNIFSSEIGSIFSSSPACRRAPRKRWMKK